MRFNPERLLGTALLLALAPLVSATTRYVNGVSGSDSNNCLSATTACKTIGHAISLAASGDIIKVAAATYTENLNIGKNLTITGSGASATIIDGGGIKTVVTISNSNVTLSKFTIRHGVATNGAGVNNSGTLTLNYSTVSGNVAHQWGGGMWNSGTLLINNSTISGNSVTIICTTQTVCVTNGGGIFNSAGTLAIKNSSIRANTASASCGRQFCHSDAGGIFNNAMLTISNSTISGNTANEAGGIDSRGKLIISNSTISGNSANFSRGNAIGGGISASSGTLISNSTISGNSASGSLGSTGGGITGTATLQNTIVANSSSGGNCYATIISSGYNLSSDNTCKLNGPGDMNNINPLLGSLANNGGPTPTMALLEGSPAIDAGNPAGCTDGSGPLLTTDQRGQPRPDKEDIIGCDIGAYEKQGD